jgi:hypothetical protein
MLTNRRIPDIKLKTNDKLHFFTCNLTYKNKNLRLLGGFYLVNLVP